LLLPFENGIRYWQISVIAMISIERVVIVIISEAQVVARRLIHVVVVTRSIRSTQRAERVVLSHCQIVAIESVAVAVERKRELRIKARSSVNDRDFFAGFVAFCLPFKCRFGVFLVC
jgi:hypothetical protein